MTRHDISCGPLTSVTTVEDAMTYEKDRTIACIGVLNRPEACLDCLLGSLSDTITSGCKIT